MLCETPDRIELMQEYQRNRLTQPAKKTIELAIPVGC